MLYVFIPWAWRHRHAVTAPIIKTFLQIVRTENPDAKIGVAGFCWGGRYSLLLGQRDTEHLHEQPLVDAVFAGHPSFVSVPKDVMVPICPSSIAAAGKDSVFTRKMAEQTDKLWEMSSREVKTEVVIYEGAEHGFCVRGNMNNPKEKEDMEKATLQVCFCFQ
jgi:dienelactone hydrolase